MNVDTVIENMLRKYGSDIKEKAYEKAEDIGKDAVQKLKATSPVGATGKYARDWAVKKVGDGVVIHNRKHYMLTHLLEKSHVIKNQYGSYGQTTPHPAGGHIKPVETEIIAEYYDEVRRIIEES